MIFIDPSKHNFDEVEELVYETNAEDISSEETYIKIITAVEDYTEVEKFLEEKGIEIMESKLDFVPDNEVEVTEFDKALKIKKMKKNLIIIFIGCFLITFYFIILL